MYLVISLSKIWILNHIFSVPVILCKFVTQGFTYIYKGEIIVPILLDHFEFITDKIPSAVLGTFTLCENFFLHFLFLHRSNNF